MCFAQVRREGEQPAAIELPAGMVERLFRGAKNGIFFGVFPMFVPSLSWQNVRFYV